MAPKRSGAERTGWNSRFSRETNRKWKGKRKKKVRWKMEVEGGGKRSRERKRKNLEENRDTVYMGIGFMRKIWEKRKKQRRQLRLQQRQKKNLRELLFGFLSLKRLTHPSPSPLSRFGWQTRLHYTELRSFTHARFFFIIITTNNSYLSFIIITVLWLIHRIMFEWFSQPSFLSIYLCIYYNGFN